jgi:hypothetical protein
MYGKIRFCMAAPLSGRLAQEQGVSEPRPGYMFFVQSSSHYALVSGTLGAVK